MDRRKVEAYLIAQCQDTDSEKDRFIKDFLIMIEFGQFEEDDDNEDSWNEEEYG